MAAVHHIELWVPDLASALPRWRWVLELLGWSDLGSWSIGHSFKADDGSYLVLEQSPARSGDVHDRMRPGMNHLAVSAADSGLVDLIAVDAELHGWRLMFPHAHPHAGGPDHYAAFLLDDDGYELEVVAATPAAGSGG